ncbi:MAG: hypothetical protein KC643_22590 [Nitrospira sp.]|nr:hypothetical protein [Nitrospira sp.]
MSIITAEIYPSGKMTVNRSEVVLGAREKMHLMGGIRLLYFVNILVSYEFEYCLIFLQINLA